MGKTKVGPMTREQLQLVIHRIDVARDSLVTAEGWMRDQGVGEINAGYQDSMEGMLAKLENFADSVRDGVSEAQFKVKFLPTNAGSPPEKSPKGAHKRPSKTR